MTKIFSSSILQIKYCDIESFVQLTNVPGIIHKHLLISIGCILVSNSELKSCPIDDANLIKIFTGTDCMTEFTNYIHRLESELFNWCHDKFKFPIDCTIPQRVQYADAIDSECKRICLNY